MHLLSRPHITFAFSIFAALMIVFTIGGRNTVHAQGSPPPGPVVFKGLVTVGGAPAPDGLSIVAKITPILLVPYESLPQLTLGGEYQLLTVGPPSSAYLYQNITFHIVPNALVPHLPADGIAAMEITMFLGGPGISDGHTLTFPALPLAPTPTPVPPTPTPVPTATAVPPTPTTVPTATPVPPTPTSVPTATAVPPTPTTVPPIPTPVTVIVVATATPEVAEQETAGTCGQSGVADLSYLLAGAALLGLIWRRKTRS